ncbi:hypothetical protein JCM24511_03858 [Saitozyma sp. JCM 24511]|nr:hypothetical protein JCM24511_03858 [Saitozyma sp. JCM 24511]
MSASTLMLPVTSRAAGSTPIQDSDDHPTSLQQCSFTEEGALSSEPVRPPPAARPAFPNRQQQQQGSSTARQVEATITSDPKLSTSLPLLPCTEPSNHSTHSNHSNHSNRSTQSNHSNHSDPFLPCLPLAPKPDPPAASPAHSSLAELGSNVPDSPPRHQPFALDPCLQPDSPVDPLEHKSWAWRTAFVIVTCSTQYLAQGQFGAVIIPLPEIGEWLGTADAGELSWMAASYGLTIGMFLVASGRLGDLYGPKLLWTTGYVLMIIANLASGFCVSRVPFDVCRGLAGMGAALSLPNAVAILGRTYPPGRTRSLMFAILGALAPAGFWAGGLIAAAFAVSGHVPWIWWFKWVRPTFSHSSRGSQVPSAKCQVPNASSIQAALFLSLGLLVLPDDTPTHFLGLSFPLQPRRFDILGTLLLALSLGLLNFSWNQSALTGWSETYVYVILILSALSFVAFFLWEKRMGRKALIPTEVLGRTSALAALLVPYAITRFPGHQIFLLSMIAFLVGSIMASVAPAHGSYWSVTMPSLILVISGPDMSFATGQLIVSNSVDREFQGIAGGIVSMITNYSMSIGLGMSGTVERYVRGPNGSQLEGYRAAFYFGTGLAGLAVFVVGVFVRMPKQAQYRE